ncbi:uncharacterized protein E0L32_003197 [Thyridium curvatum]|uniref:Mediator of RNA polymerase II transcription subunit 31 n=1 Tax=Thyridium curvatum TaxID=1093900 RepID=A0A507BI67_9PEZI|nr:uncharacterized protein E0L32_003197 [Thyridium curvatum]TPX17079.1 hypothetical protein E0L32_003197 [Thyridium curvatum]
MATASEPPTLQAAPVEPKYGGATRFELELEFVQALGNPLYVNYLATQKFFTQPAFVAYLEYLQYWKHPPYSKYLTYPGPALKMLELLQQERFRQDAISPDVMNRLMQDWLRDAVLWHRESQ